MHMYVRTYVHIIARGNSEFIARLAYAILFELFVTVVIWSPQGVRGAFQQTHYETRNRFAELYRTDGIISAKGCKFLDGLACVSLRIRGAVI